MTPETRAAQVLNAAAELNLVDGYTRTQVAQWHSLIAEAVTAALIEARESCQFIPDRDAISALMVGPTALGDQPGVKECFVCEAVGRLGAVECHACRGVGRIMDSGAALPEGEDPGLLGVKPCGCAQDWIGSLAAPEDRERRRALWKEQGWTELGIDWSQARLRLADDAACTHDRREHPREAVGAPDVAAP